MKYIEKNIRCFSEARTFLRSRSKRITEFLLCFPRASRVEVESDSLVLPVFLWYPRAAKMPSIQQSTGYLLRGGIVLPPKGHIDNSQREIEFFLCPVLQMLGFLSLDTSRAHTDPSRGRAWVPLAGVYSVLCFLDVHMLHPALKIAPASLEIQIAQLEHSRNLVNSWWGGKLMVNWSPFHMH